MFTDRMTDDQLKERLVRAYIQADASPEIDNLRAELYRHGYRWGDIVELAVVSLMRRHRYAPAIASLN